MGNVITRLNTLKIPLKIHVLTSADRVSLHQGQRIDKAVLIRIVQREFAPSPKRELVVALEYIRYLNNRTDNFADSDWDHNYGHWLNFAKTQEGWCYKEHQELSKEPGYKLLIGYNNQKDLKIRRIIRYYR